MDLPGAQEPLSTTIRKLQDRLAALEASRSRLRVGEWVITADGASLVAVHAPTGARKVIAP